MLKEGLKQPFLQIWEPVASDVREDRYENCSIAVKNFLNHEKDGITVSTAFGDGYESHPRVSLKGCRLTDYYDAGDNDEPVIVIKNFQFERMTRQVNHIVGLLDGWTALDRIKKDDVGVVNQLNQLTLAQITEFINAAQGTNAKNVMAALLEYKNAHFPDFNPMSEFALEDW